MKSEKLIRYEYERAEAGLAENFLNEYNLTAEGIVDFLEDRIRQAMTVVLLGWVLDEQTD